MTGCAAANSQRNAEQHEQLRNSAEVLIRLARSTGTAGVSTSGTNLVSTTALKQQSLEHVVNLTEGRAFLFIFILNVSY